MSECRFADITASLIEGFGTYTSYGKAKNWPSGETCNVPRIVGPGISPTSDGSHLRVTFERFFVGLPSKRRTMNSRRLNRLENILGHSLASSRSSRRHRCARCLPIPSDKNAALRGVRPPISLLLCLPSRLANPRQYPPDMWSNCKMATHDRRRYVAKISKRTALGTVALHDPKLAVSTHRQNLPHW